MSCRRFILFREDNQPRAGTAALERGRRAFHPAAGEVAKGAPPGEPGKAGRGAQAPHTEVPT